MPRTVPLPDVLGQGAFTVGEAHRSGIGEGRLRSAELSRPAHGVRRIGPTTSLAQLADATRLVLPGGSAFSHLTAARLMALPVPRRWTPRELLEVMNVTSAPMVRRAGCRGHRGVESRRVVIRRGLRVVSPEDTWCDLAAAGALDLDELIVLGDAVLHYQRGISPDLLAGAVGRRRGQRGTLLMAEAFPIFGRAATHRWRPGRVCSFCAEGCPSLSSTSSSTTRTRGSGCRTRTSSGVSRR